MINVTLVKERVWTKVKGDYIFGSCLVNGGKDQYGKNKPNGFVNVKFSNECQDKIYDTFNGKIPEAITITGDGFLSWNEYGEVKEDVIVINNLFDALEYVKEAKNSTPTTPSRRKSSH